jgi:hypothetical protein
MAKMPGAAYPFVGREADFVGRKGKGPPPRPLPTPDASHRPWLPRNGRPRHRVRTRKSVAPPSPRRSRSTPAPRGGCFRRRHTAINSPQKPGRRPWLAPALHLQSHASRRRPQCSATASPSDIASRAALVHRCSCLTTLHPPHSNHVMRRQLGQHHTRHPASTSPSTRRRVLVPGPAPARRLQGHASRRRPRMLSDDIAWRDSRSRVAAPQLAVLPT